MLCFDFKDQWYQDIEAVFENPVVKQYVLKAEEVPMEFKKNSAEMFSSTLDKVFSSYHKAWDKTAQIHEADGLYAKIADFAKPNKDDLIVDIGCGSGNLLAEFASRGHRRLIGIDISPNALESAYNRLKQIIPETECCPESVVSFDPYRGFFLKGKPIMDELDFNHPQLICDDMRTMDNLVRVLYLQGMKADIATFTLHGGYNAEGLEFLTYLFPEYFKEEESPQFMVQVVESLIAKVVKTKGFLVHSLRGGLMDENGVVHTALTSKQDRRAVLKSARIAYKELYNGALVPVSIRLEAMRQEHDLIGLRGAVAETKYTCLISKIRIERGVVRNENT